MRFYETLAAACSRPVPFALALIAGTKGSSPQRAGAKALFFADGTMAGTLGGGCLEAEVRQRSLKALETGQPESFEIALDHLFGWDDGLICGGSVKGVILPHARAEAALWRELADPALPKAVRWGIGEAFAVVREPEEEGRYRETVAPPVALWIAGSGHVAQAVAPLALQLDFAVTVFDDRPAFAHPDFFPLAVRLRVGAWHELLQDAPGAEVPAFGLIITRGHQHDALVLSEWIGFPFAFLGMIGSRRKARVIREQFLKRDLATAERFDRIACPVGLAIGAVGPQEIAVSVVAQLIEKRAALAKA